MGNELSWDTSGDLNKETESMLIEKPYLKTPTG